ncbi:MAG: SH3 domain-containing protein [Proteobacteria bacterium]|nr:SH3 domain-containing protein [Pseudomonadota bacterium]
MDPIKLKNVKAVTLFAYKGQSKKDLSFQKDETITVLSQGKHWWTGEKLDGTKGEFPSNYVKVIEAQHNPETEYSQLERSRMTIDGPSAVALYDYRARSTSDLSFRKDDRIKLLSQEGSWWVGVGPGGKKGTFPSNYVHVAAENANSKKTDGPLEENEGNQLEGGTATITGPTAIALYDYKASAAGDLSLRKGDTIKLLSQDGSWWIGIGPGGNQGKFPSNYVKVNETPISSPPTNSLKNDQTIYSGVVYSEPRFTQLTN